MKHFDSDDNEQWEDIVRRLGGTPDQAHTPPITETPEGYEASSAEDTSHGPRDYHLADEVVEDFQPPEPKPIASGNPRTVLSWFGVIGATVVWMVAALLSLTLPWWLAVATLVGFFGGGVSLFFLLPKSWTDRDPLDNDDYGGGAKL